MAAPQQYVRILLFGKKKKSITLEEMYEHWSKVHAPLVVPFLKNVVGAISYNQVPILPHRQ
jgi:hypothetical protein